MTPICAFCLFCLCQLVRVMEGYTTFKKKLLYMTLNSKGLHGFTTGERSWCSLVNLFLLIWQESEHICV